MRYVVAGVVLAVLLAAVVMLTSTTGVFHDEGASRHAVTGVAWS